MCAHQNGSIKSDNVKATYDGTKWSTSEVINYSPSYQYYAYYPYSTNGLSHLGASSSKGSILASEISAASGTQAANGAHAANGARAANATRAVSANTSASDFFASGISAFTPATDQSTVANFNASDLQVAKGTISRVDASDVTFSMAHSMGLARITLGTRNVPTTITYNGNTGAVSSQAGSSTLTACSTFSGNIPYTTRTANLYASIVRPSTNTTFASVTTDANAWSQITNIASGSAASYTPVLFRTGVHMIWNFPFLGSVKEFSVPIKGTYKLEVWGGQGFHTHSPGIGGKGGYSYGNYSGVTGEQLFVCVGDSGGHWAHGYNGAELDYASARGGGATHIATTNRGVLSKYANYQSEVLIVAGGGGGSEWSYVGGAGGGETGGRATNSTEDTGSDSHCGYGGTQSAGGKSVEWLPLNGAKTGNVVVDGSFGQGGYGYTTQEVGYDPGPGGGWYGGGGCAYAGGSGGGSGHINETYITNGTMENGVREGTGYATITYVP